MQYYQCGKYPIEFVLSEDIVQKLLLEIMEQGIFGMMPHQFCIQNRIRKSQGCWMGRRQSAGLLRKWGFMTRAILTRLSKGLLGYLHQSISIPKSK